MTTHNLAASPTTIRRGMFDGTFLPSLGAHLVTGPVAEPGDMLEICIDAIELGADWSYCAFHPLIGSLPEDFPFRDVSHIPVNVAKKTCKLPWGPELPLAPFFGVMAAAPPTECRGLSGLLLIAG